MRASLTSRFFPTKTFVVLPTAVTIESSNSCQQGRPPGWERIIARVGQLTDAGSLDEAQEYLVSVLEDYPSFADAHFKLAHIYYT